MKARLFFTSAIVMFAVALVGADKAEKKEAGKKKDPLKGITCVVSGKAINPEATAEYKEGKVYFCCENCPNAFKKNTKKFAAKANHQLYATKQVKQENCPLTKRELNVDKKVRVKVAGVAVRFCCKNCQGKVAKTEKDKQIVLVFNDEAFKKGFKFAKAKKGGKDKKAKAAG